jgi:hypothetical protein
MSNVARLMRDAVPAPSASDYLGPAVVTGARADRVELRLASGEALEATLALAFPYRPVEEDVVLVIGKGEAHYVIGVLRSHGQTCLAFDGDVTLRAVGGRLNLAADEGVAIQGKELEIAVGAIKMVADSMVQKLATAYQRVTGLVSVRAGESHAIVDGAATQRAKSAAILTEEKMTINGKQIFLG